MPRGANGCAGRSPARRGEQAVAAEQVASAQCEPSAPVACWKEIAAIEQAPAAEGENGSWGSRQEKEFVAVEQHAAKRRQAVLARRAAPQSRSSLGARLPAQGALVNAAHLLAATSSPASAHDALGEGVRDCSSVNRLLNRFSAWIGVVDSRRAAELWPASGQSNAPKIASALAADFVRVDHPPQSLALDRLDRLEAR